MIKLIEFWITNKAGIPLYHQKANQTIESVNKNLVSGFISAFSSVVSQDSQEVEAIKFKDTKLVIFPVSTYDLFFIARTNLKEKEKSIRKDLRKISEMFVTEYRTKLIEWDGEIVVFENFRYKIVQYWQ